MKKATGICALAALLPAIFLLTRILPPLPAAEPAARPPAEPKESYSAAPALQAPARPSVYVGARVCASCHEGRQQGDQMSRWLLSKHSQAYAVLAWPESKRIAELSGIPLEPQRSTMCLGCHATGTFAEAVGEGRHVLCRRRRPVRNVPRAGQRARGGASREECGGRQAGGAAEAVHARLHGLPQRERIAHGRAETAARGHGQGMGEHCPPHAVGLGPEHAPPKPLGAHRRPAATPRNIRA